MKSFQFFLNNIKYSNGLYASVIPNLQQYYQAIQPIKEVILLQMNDDPHITIVYSKNVISDLHAEETRNISCKSDISRITAITGLKSWKSNKWYLGLLLDDTNLKCINEIYKDAGYQPYQFPNYMPHITLCSSEEPFTVYETEIKRLNVFYSFSKIPLSFGEDILTNLED
jgi:2'-5' RNA ligase